LAEDTEELARSRVGTVLDDKWTLERMLGVGGMAAVYSAKHRNGARAAVKLLHPELSRHREVRERFVREGYAANSVEHPGAVKVLDDDVVVSGPEAGTAYIVMELLEGESLQDRLERGPPMGERELLAITASVLEVLEAAHARGVVHRDLKPENLFLVREDGADAASGVKVKVLDFGLARLLQGQAITSYGLALGTPSFMSPEQAAGRIDEIDGRTDLFALAATGFRICAGRRIHEAGNAVDLVRKMASMAAPKVRTVRPDVSEPCARVIDRALEFRREDRYASAGEMLEDVRRASRELEASGPTHLAMPSPLAATAVAAPDGRRPDSMKPERSDEQATIELSQGDLREVPQPLPPLAMDESIHIPRRRSVLPWLLLLVAGGVGARLWLQRRAAPAGDAAAIASATGSAAASASGHEPGALASAAPAASAASVAEAPAALRDRDAGASGDPGAKTASSASPGGKAPPGVPNASATHRAAPGKVGPANVHKLPPHKHRTTTKHAP
jgi:serine/threonine-protein kinase